MMRTHRSIAVNVALLLVIAFAASGCAQLYGFAASQLPSLEYCNKVVYLRDGSDVSIQANCRAPVR
jgi:hypothetical protein